MKKTIIFTILGLVVGLAIGCMWTMFYFGKTLARGMFMFQEVEICEMEIAAVEAYYNEPNEVAIWALENYIKRLENVKKERSSSKAENPYLVLFPDNSLVFARARLGQLYKKMNDIEKSKKNFEIAMSDIEKAGIKVKIETKDELIALIEKLDREFLEN